MALLMETFKRNNIHGRLVFGFSRDERHKSDFETGIRTNFIHVGNDLLQG